MCKLKIPSTCSVDGHESLTYCLLPKRVLPPALQLCFCHITLVPCSSHSALQGLPGSLNCLPRPFSVCPPSSIFPPPTFPAKLVFVLQWKHTIYLLTHKSSTITFPAICILTYQKTLDPSLVKLFLSPQPQAHLPEFQQKMSVPLSGPGYRVCPPENSMEPSLNKTQVGIPQEKHFVGKVA